MNATLPITSRLRTAGWRRRRRRDASAPEPGRAPLGLVGRDVSRGKARLRARPSLWLPLVTAALAGALVLVALRVDLIRMRYDLGDALAHEQRLREEKRHLTVSMRTLRSPAALRGLASELGYVRPLRIIDLEEPGGRHDRTAATTPRRSAP